MTFWWMGTIVASLAGLTQGLTGFGFALVFTPLAALFLSPRVAVFSALVLSASLSGAVIIQTRAHLRWSTVLVMVGASALGTLPGLVALTILPEGTLRVVIIIATLLAASAFFAWRPRPLPPRFERGGLAMASFIGGVLNGSTSMGGPPVALLIAAQGWRTDEVRGSLAAFNLLSSLIGTGVLLSSGIVDSAALTAALYWLPAALVGSVTGALLSRRVPHRVFPLVLAGTVLASVGLTVVLFLIH